MMTAGQAEWRSAGAEHQLNNLCKELKKPVVFLLGFVVLTSPFHLLLLKYPRLDVVETNDAHTSPL